MLFTVLPIVLLQVVPVALTIEVLVLEFHGGSFAVDFHHAFWPAGRDVLHGHSPYPDPDSAELLRGTAFVYPAPAALAMVPFALLPLQVAEVVFTAILLAIPIACLWLLGVRDARCYTGIFLWAPVLLAVQTANLTLPIALGCAVLWRYRNHASRAALAAAAMIVLKVFVWPLLVWLVATRRWKASLVATATAVGVTVGAWGVIGFAGLSDYPHLLSRLSRVEAPASYTPQALALLLGAPDFVASGIRLAVAAAVLAAAIVVARQPRGDFSSFALAISASILFSPIVWLHYFALLLVPVAIARPRYSPVWLLPAALWVCPVRPAGPTWLTILVLADFAAVTALCLWARRPLSAVFEPETQPA